MNANPIAGLLGIPAALDRRVIVICGEAFELCPGRGDIAETLYRVNPGYCVGNPGFSLYLTPETHHAIALGQYFAKPRGIKRAEAETLIANARRALAA